jgi:hypothetical protein
MATEGLHGLGVDRSRISGAAADPGIAEIRPPALEDLPVASLPRRRRPNGSRVGRRRSHEGRGWWRCWCTTGEAAATGARV